MRKSGLGPGRIVALGMMLGGLAAVASVPPDALEPKARDPKKERPVPFVDSIPEEISIEMGSPHYDYETAQKLEVWLNGARRPNDVIAYSVPEGWVKLQGGTLLRGKVEPRWRPPPAPRVAAPHGSPEVQTSAQAAAEAKRARRAAKRLELMAHGALK
jgi:hypothetical protein